jgi:hypothetical protein
MLAGRPAYGDSFTFDDIEYWVGAGVNRAALVIDWDESTSQTPALAWGFRWDGAATGAAMLLSILAEDDRLFAKLGRRNGQPAIVYGLGYDADDDGNFGVSGNTTFDQDGIAYTGPADGAQRIDSDDYYGEGWRTAFWHYGSADANPYPGGTWSANEFIGMADRILTDGAWDSWVYSPTFDFQSFAQNPQSAASPYTAGDFNRDGTVDRADYTRWKSSYGLTTDPAADGNRNGTVDAADYTVWRNHVTYAAGSIVSPLTVPEPAAIWMVLLCALCMAARANRQW